MKLSEIIKRALDHRGPLLAGTEEQAIRLFNGQADGIEGLTADLYGEYLLLQYYSPEAEGVLRSCADLLAEILILMGRPVLGALSKDRTLPGSGKEVTQESDGPESLLLFGSPPPSDYHVSHNGITAALDLLRGQNTGLFHDMREVREKLKDYISPGSSMLNLFCYTGIFSVFFMKNGGARAQNIDISGSVLKKAELNYRINSLIPDARDFTKEDSLKWIRYCERKGVSYSLAVFDPPSFARNKKGSFSVRRDYPASLELLGRICAGGHILTAVNTYSISRQEYLDMHPRGWKTEFLGNEAADFRYTDKPYLKTALWRIPT